MVQSDNARRFLPPLGSLAPGNLSIAPVRPVIAPLGDSVDRALNRLLAALPDRELSELTRELEPVSLRAGDVLMEAGAATAYVYFPETAVVIVGPDADTDVLPVGRDGMLGLAAVLGEEVSLLHAAVAVPGRVQRLSVAALRRAMTELPSLRPLLARHLHLSLAQAVRTAACARAHGLEQRLASLLVWVHDQAGTSRIPLTHERLARLLGTARRATITESLLTLRGRALLRGRRGSLTIEDPAGLRAVACACYGEAHAGVDRTKTLDGPVI